MPTKPGQDLQCKRNKCHKVHSAESKSGTGNLLRPRTVCVQMTSDIGQYLITSNNQGELTSQSSRSQFSQEKFRNLMMHAIIRHELPFSFVVYAGIRDVCSYLKKEVKHVTRNTAKADIKKLHLKEVYGLRAELQSCPSRICLTSDAWSSVVTDGYF